MSNDVQLAGGGSPAEEFGGSLFKNWEVWIRNVPDLREL